MKQKEKLYNEWMVINSQIQAIDPNFIGQIMSAEQIKEYTVSEWQDKHTPSLLSRWANLQPITPSSQR